MEERKRLSEVRGRDPRKAAFPRLVSPSSQSFPNRAHRKVPKFSQRHLLKCPNSRVRRDALLTKEFWFSLDEVLLYRYLDREQFRATFFSIFHCQHGAGKFLCI